MYYSMMIPFSTFVSVLVSVYTLKIYLPFNIKLYVNHFYDVENFAIGKSIIDIFVFPFTLYRILKWQKFSH